MALEYGTPNMPEMVDGKTRLGGTYFNPLHKRLDQRVSVLEALKVSWEDATALLTSQGLTRIDAVLGPAFEEIDEALTSLAAILAGAQADLDAAAEGALDQIQPQIDAALEDVDTALAALETAVTDGTAAIATAVGQANNARDAANAAATAANDAADGITDVIEASSRTARYYTDWIGG